MTDQDGKFRSVLTDGDLRRMQSKKKGLTKKLTEDYFNRSSVIARQGENIQELMRKTNKKVRIIPILNNNDEIVDYFEYNHKTHFTPVAEPDLTGKEMEFNGCFFVDLDFIERSIY